mgnify:CR=1 FL=1
MDGYFITGGKKMKNQFYNYLDKIVIILEKGKHKEVKGRVSHVDKKFIILTTGSSAFEPNPYLIPIKNIEEIQCLKK